MAKDEKQSGRPILTFFAVIFFILFMIISSNEIIKINKIHRCNIFFNRFHTAYEAGHRKHGAKKVGVGLEYDIQRLQRFLEYLL